MHTSLSSIQPLWKSDVFSSHYLVKTFNTDESELPQIVILPEYHETEPTDESKLREALDRHINQAVIDQFYQPGDIILVEESAHTDIDQSVLPQTKELRNRVKILGWDDPHSRQRLQDIYELFAKHLPVLMEDGYREASKYEEYLNAWTKLREQDYRSWKDLQLPFSAVRLPHPLMNEDDYWMACSNTQFALRDHFYNMIPVCYEQRQRSLENSIKSVFEKYKPGRVFILGGYVHFLGRENSSDSKMKDALEAFHQSLESSGKSAAILTPPNVMRSFHKVSEGA